MRWPNPALIIACLALLLAAGGVAYGRTQSTGQLVNIVDPANAALAAKVDSAGKLYVGDGNGALSVDGTVLARPQAPASPWRASEDIQSGLVRIAGPSSTPINVTSLSVSTDATSGSNLNVYLFVYHVAGTASSCADPSLANDGTMWHIRDAGDGVTPVSFSFPTPLQWKPPANTKACLFAEAPSASTTTMNAVGFYGG